MTDVQIFHATLDGARELEATSFRSEKELQSLFERHLRDLTGIDFVKSEHRTGSRHNRRADTLGLDSQQRPVVIEYKLGHGGAAISQGLDYLFWLEDHKGDFRELVRDSLGTDRSKYIDFRNARLLCVAGEFRREDIINAETNTRRIELLCVRRHGASTIFMEWVLGGIEVRNTKDEDKTVREERQREAGRKAAETRPRNQAEHQQGQPDFSIHVRWYKADAELRQLFMELYTFVVALGEDVRVVPVQQYISFKREQNAVDVSLQTGKRRLLCWLRLNPDSVRLQQGFTRDVTHIGHSSPNRLELIIASLNDLERAKALIKRSYEEAG